MINCIKTHIVWVREKIGIPVDILVYRLKFKTLNITSFLGLISVICCKSYIFNCYNMSNVHTMQLFYYFLIIPHCILLCELHIDYLLISVFLVILLLYNHFFIDLFVYHHAGS